MSIWLSSSLEKINGTTVNPKADKASKQAHKDFSSLKPLITSQTIKVKFRFLHSFASKSLILPDAKLRGFL